MSPCLSSDPNSYIEARGIPDALATFPAKEVIYMVGEEDNDPSHQYLETSRRVAVQGRTRLERTVNYYKHLRKLFGAGKTGSQHLCILPGVGHQSYEGFSSPGGRHWIFDHGKRTDGPVERYLATHRSEYPPLSPACRACVLTKKEPSVMGNTSTFRRRR